MMKKVLKKKSDYTCCNHLNRLIIYLKKFNKFKEFKEFNNFLS